MGNYCKRWRPCVKGLSLDGGRADFLKTRRDISFYKVLWNDSNSGRPREGLSRNKMLPFRLKLMPPAPRACILPLDCKGPKQFRQHHKEYIFNTTTSHRCLYTASSIDVHGVFPPQAEWTCRVSLHHQQYGCAWCFSTTSSMDVQGVSLTPAEWTCRVFLHQQQYGRTKVSLHHQQYGCAIVHGVSPPPAVWTFRVSLHHM
jgi:hypothetical protein